MAFPTTSVLDNFNRTTETPLSDGGNWTNPLIFGNSQINTISNTVAQGSSTSNSAYRSNTTYGPNSEAYITLAGKSGNNLVAVYARMANPNSSGASDGYDVSIAISGSTDTMRVGRIDNDGRTIIASASQEVSAGDSIGLECNGSTISAYYKPSASGWNATPTASTTDATYGSAGYVGLQLNGTNHTADDFGGGTIPASSVSITPTVGSAVLTGAAPRMNFGVIVPTEV